jgi:hypothetical protein
VGGGFLARSRIRHLVITKGPVSVPVPAQRVPQLILMTILPGPGGYDTTNLAYLGAQPLFDELVVCTSRTTTYQRSGRVAPLPLPLAHWLQFAVIVLWWVEDPTMRLAVTVQLDIYTLNRPAGDRHRSAPHAAASPGG